MSEKSAVDAAVDPQVLATAGDLATRALADPRTIELVSSFYDPTSDFAGATFANLQPADPERISAADLLSVTTMSVSIVPLAIRRILGENANEITDLLAALPSRRLEYATDEDFVPMVQFYDRVKQLLAPAGSKDPNRWVTASKLAARKRPGLFPVRDRVVCGYLGILPLDDRAKDWAVFRYLMQDPAIREHLDGLARALDERTTGSVERDKEPLRLLDAALWRFASTARS